MLTSTAQRMTGLLTQIACMVCFGAAPSFLQQQYLEQVTASLGHAEQTNQALEHELSEAKRQLASHPETEATALLQEAAALLQEATAQPQDAAAPSTPTAAKDTELSEAQWETRVHNALQSLSLLSNPSTPVVSRGEWNKPCYVPRQAGAALFLLGSR